MPGDWPHVVVAMLCVDPEFEKTLLLHRSDKVRSAKNAWALPSGLVDIGETAATAIERELVEELSLNVERILPWATPYENIARVDGFHWNIAIHTVVCPNLENYQNNEPDKHDEVEIVRLSRLHDVLTSNRVWTPGQKEALNTHMMVLACMVHYHRRSGYRKHGFVD